MYSVREKLTRGGESRERKRSRNIVSLVVKRLWTGFQEDMNERRSVRFLLDSGRRYTSVRIDIRVYCRPCIYIYTVALDLW